MLLELMCQKPSKILSITTLVSILIGSRASNHIPVRSCSRSRTSEYSQEYDTSIDPAAPDTSKYSPQYDPPLTPTLPEGSGYYQPHAPLLYPALPDGFQNSQQYNLAAAENTAARRRQARGSSLRPEVAPSAGFQAQASNHEGDGTEAEPRRAIRESECSVDAAERNIWHVAMNKHGVYRPSGELQRSEDGTMQWREPKGVVGVNVLNPVMNFIAYLT